MWTVSLTPSSLYQNGCFQQQHKHTSLSTDQFYTNDRTIWNIACDCNHHANFCHHCPLWWQCSGYSQCQPQSRVAHHHKLVCSESGMFWYLSDSTANSRYPPMDQTGVTEELIHLYDTYVLGRLFPSGQPSNPDRWVKHIPFITQSHNFNWQLRQEAIASIRILECQLKKHLLILQGISVTSLMITSSRPQMFLSFTRLLPFSCTGLLTSISSSPPMQLIPSPHSFPNFILARLL